MTDLTDPDLLTASDKDVLLNPRTLLQRLQAVREELSYIQKDELPGSAPYGSAVSHASLLKKIRSSMVSQGILWFPVKVQVLKSERYEITDAAGGTKQMFWCEQIITTRFCRMNDDPGPVDFTRGTQGFDCLDIPVLVHGLDSQDKGPGKASTYSDKYALMRVLNLESGDDPDMDEKNHDPDMSEAMAAKIEKIRAMALAQEGKNWENYLRDNVAAWGRKYNRRVATIAGLDEKILDMWIKALEERK